MEKTAGLRSGNFSDLNSACQKVLIPVKIFQFQDMLNENRFIDTFRGHSKRTNSCFYYFATLAFGKSLCSYLNSSFYMGSCQKFIALIYTSATDIFRYAFVKEL